MVTQKIVDVFADVEKFHEKYNLAYDGKPRFLPEELRRFRQDFMNEELDEYLTHDAQAFRAMAEGDNAEFVHQMAMMLDSLMDLVYITIGTGYMHGYDMREAWARIHRANMAKVRAEVSSDSKRGSTWDVVKPPGWEPPSSSRRCRSSCCDGW
jgi:predicted HAD superfamily Cof-like phosphohydrolase